MGTNQSPDNQEHVSRREAIGRGVCGVAGMIAAGGLSSRVFAATAEKTPRRRSSPKRRRPRRGGQGQGQGQEGPGQIGHPDLLVGGMSHNDTWDPKAGTATNTWVSLTSSSLPTWGIQLGALFPKLAKQADKYSLIRSMTHGNNGHETAAYLMQTGHQPAGAWLTQCRRHLHLFKKAQYKGLLPPYVVMLEAAGRFSRRASWAPRTSLSPRAAIPTRPASSAGNRQSRNRRRAAKARRELAIRSISLATAWRTSRRWLPRGGQAEGLRFDLGQGEGSLQPRQRTGGTPRSLRPAHVRAGMPGGAADGRGGRALRHDQLPRRLGHALQPLCDDAATVSHVGPRAAMLLADLGDRGLLDSTLVWCTGEFGRTRSLLEPPWNGGAITTGTSLPCWSPAADSRAAASSARPTRKAKRSRNAPSIPRTCWEACTCWPASTPRPSCPSLGLDAYVLDAENEGMKSAGLLEEII